MNTRFLLSYSRLPRTGLVAGIRPAHTHIRHSSSASTPLYAGHIPTNSLQKAVLAAGSAVCGFIDPTRADLIAALGETTGACALQNIRKKMMADENGLEILTKRPFISLSTLPETLKDLPPNTFGGAYYRWMGGYGYIPDERPPVRLVDDADLAYVLLRYRQVHDFWHVLAGLGTTVHEEVAVKWLEMVQTGLPMTVLSSLFGGARCSLRDQAELLTKMVPWAVSCGRNATFLMNVCSEQQYALKNQRNFR